MKRILKIVGVFLVAILITGCMNANMTMDVNEDKSVNINAKVEINMLEYAKAMAGFDETMQNMTDDELKAYLDEQMNSEDFNMDSMISEEEVKEMEDLGYKVDASLDKENYTYTVTMTQHFNNIDDISTTDKNYKAEENKNIFFIKTESGTYKSSFSKLDNTETDSEIEIPSEMFASITYNYEITLPDKPISNNATTVSQDGKTLTWKLNASSKDNIDFEFSFPEPKEEPKQESNEESKQESKTPATTSTGFKNLFENMSNEKILAIGLIAGGSITFIVTLIAFIISNKKS